MTKPTVSAAATGLPGLPALAALETERRRLLTEFDDRTSVLWRLAEAALLAAKGLQSAIEDGVASEQEAEGMVEIAFLVAAKAHALRSAVTGEPPKLVTDLSTPMSTHHASRP